MAMLWMLDPSTKQATATMTAYLPKGLSRVKFSTLVKFLQVQ